MIDALAFRQTALSAIEYRLWLILNAAPDLACETNDIII